MCCVDDPSYFVMLLLDMSEDNSASQIILFDDFHFHNRYIVEMVQTIY